MDCRPLPPFALDDLASVRAAFRDATPIPLRQAWLKTPEQDFAPGSVRTGWREDSLFVLADLYDVDVFTRAEQHNERFWQLGDTFEIFLQPAPGRPYVELHVAPTNLRLQLRFAKPPSASDADPFGIALIHDQVYDSRTWVTAAEHGWRAFARIRAAVVGHSGPQASAAWRVSFGRYDATRGRQEPVISSTSPHTVPAFHRPHEWSDLRFVGATAI